MVALGAAHLALPTWLVEAPTLRRAGVGVLLVLATGAASFVLGLSRRLARRAFVATGPWAITVLLIAGGIVEAARGARFQALVALLGVLLTGAGALLARRVEQRTGSPAAGTVAFSLLVGWVLGMWCPIL